MSKRLFLLSALCVLLCGGQSFAQVLSGVKGILKISDTEPAVSASVQLKNDKKVKSAITNQDGEFTFQKIHPGHYKLIISMVGYENVEQELDVVKDEITRLEFKLKSVSGSLDDVTVRGASKYVIDDVSGSLRLQTPLLEVPQNIQVISAQLIADQQVFDMVDGVTRNVSGATRSGHWDNQYANIRMRGSKTPAFRNGMNIEASWGPTAEDMSMVERIEFVKGPAGFMLAAGEPGGFYNVVTKKPTGNTKGSANLSFGSFSTYRGAFDFDGKLTKNGKLLYRLNVMAQQKDSHVKYNFNNRYLVAPVLKYILDEKTSVTFEYTYQGSSYGTNGTYAFSPKELGDVANDFSYGDPAIAPGKLRDHSVYAYIDHRFNSKWQMNAQVAYFNFEMVANSIWPSKIYANGNMERAYSVGDEAGENRFAQLSFRGVEHTGAIKHTLLAGVDAGNKKFWGDFRQQTANLKLGGGRIFNVYNPIYGVPFDSIPKIDRSLSVKTRAAQSTYITSNNYVSAYLQDELAFFDEKLRVSVAGRFTHAEIVAKTDAADVVSDVFTPRVGISYSINSEMSVYTLYDQSFIPVAGTDYDGNAFVPIRGNDIEFGIKKEWFHGRLRTTGTIYQIKRKNALVADDRIGANGQTFQTQLGETTTKGVEIDVNGEVLPGLNASMNYAYTDSKITAEAKGTDPAKTTIGNITPGTAAHITNAWLQYRIRSGFFQGFGASFGMQWQAERAVGATKEPNIPNYFRTDAGISYNRDKYAITLMVNNLGDDRQLYTSVTLPSASTNYYTWIAEPRRNFRTTITYRF